ncbi:MAG: ABC transporter ATP-binding protein [Microbacteriaceae bacterium]|nr:ABC transporter ATP-binding protein [Microbacteriaceae bacterium]
MWIREALVDGPAGTRAVVALGWLRAALLAVAAVAIGGIVDGLVRAAGAGVPTADGGAPAGAGDWSGLAALLGGATDPHSGPPLAWLVALAVAAALGGALAGGIAEALPGRMQGREERAWRRRLLAGALEGRLRAAAPAHPGRPAGAGRTGRSGGAGRPGGPAHPGAAHPGAAHPGPPAEGAVLDAATSGVEKTAGYRASFLGPTLGAFTAPLLVLAVWALAIDALSGLVLAAFVALVPLVIVVAGRRLRRSNHEFRRRETAAANRYLEMLEGLGTLRVLGAARRASDEFAASARAAMAALGRLLARNQLMIVVNDAVFSIGMGAVAVALVLRRLSDGAISPGGAVAAVLLTVLLHEPIDRVGRTFYIGLGGRARRDQLVAMLADADADADADSDAGVGAGAPGSTAAAPGAPGPNAPRAATPSPASAPRLELRGLAVDLDGTRILHGLDLELVAGGTTAIVGPSGAGKTTLLRAIGGLQAFEGEVRLDGEPADPARLRAATTRVGQHPAILSTTIADNLRLVAPDADEARLRDALARAELLDEALARPGGLESDVGEAGAQLSGGQRRRLAIARALLRDRPVLLLDEPTADLDRRTETRVRRSLARAAAGRTVVLVAHRLDTVLDADLVVVLDGGRIVDRGAPAELAARSGWFAEALGAGEVRA